MTATQFAWGVLGMGDFPPPRPADGARCWLCGGDTGGVGWRRSDAIPTTFANHNIARAQTSDAVCQSCAALAGGETWQRYVAERKPAGVKVWGTASWRNYSHLFVAPHHHECPSGRRWREVLMAPPAHPFLAILSLSGKKNLIFRGIVAQGSAAFPIQVEEETVVVVHAEFVRCALDVDAAIAAGLRKADVITGRYHPAAMAALGPRRWREIEAPLRAWRNTNPPLLALVVHVTWGAATKGQTDKANADGV